MNIDPDRPRSGLQDAAETVRWIEEAGRRGVAWPGDLAVREHCREVVRHVAEELGGLDLLVNNGSVVALRGSPTLLEYSATKGAVHVFTMSLAAQPAEVAPAFVFFASADSRFCTGEILAVTGSTGTR